MHPGAGRSYLAIPGPSVMPDRVLQAMQRWADDDLRSLNAQIEFVLRQALREGGRLKAEPPAPEPEPPTDD